jgi:DNA-binding NarL/FixJ family response regulator
MYDQVHERARSSHIESERTGFSPEKSQRLQALPYDPFFPARRAREPANGCGRLRGWGVMRLTIADDHQIVRVGLRALLEAQPDLTVVGEAATADGALKLILEEQPDVALLDINMPGGSGLTVVSTVRATLPSTRLLVLSMHADWDTVRDAVTRGAHGYISKSAEPDEIVQAVRSVAAGRAFLSVPADAQAACMLRSDPPPPPSRSSAPPARSLSERERQVLELFARGYTHRQIAEALGIRAKTIETYRARLGAKFGARTLAEIVHSAREHGLLLKPLQQPLVGS